MTAIKKSTETTSIVKNDGIKPDLGSGNSIISSVKDDYNGTIVDTSLDIEKAIFFQAVSKSVLLLMQQHGYSRARATSLMLEEIRQSDDHPTEEEVFNAMESLRLGMDDARKTVTVAKAFKRSLAATKTSKEDAVRNLTNQLEASKLLQKVTRPSLPSLEGQHRSSLSDSVPDFQTLLKECKQIVSKEIEILPPTIISNSRNVNNIQRNVKTKSRVAASSGKGQRKRHLPLDETNDVDPVVEKKANNLKDHKKSDRSSSPSPGIPRKRTSPELQNQQASKRHRCDSV